MPLKVELLRFAEFLLASLSLRAGSSKGFEAVTLDTYNPEQSPEPEDWLATDEMNRQLLVEEYHRSKRIKVPDDRLHACIHVIVENQLALEDQAPVRETLCRLISEGLSRHDAVHAIGTVVAEQIHDIMSTGRPADPTQADYFAALGKLTAAKWLASGPHARAKPVKRRSRPSRKKRR
jgi:hypothetical protein